MREFWQRLRQTLRPGGAEVLDSLLSNLAALTPEFVLDWVQHRGLLVHEAPLTFAGDATAALYLGNQGAVEDDRNERKSLEAIKAAARMALLS